MAIWLYVSETIKMDLIFDPVILLLEIYTKEIVQMKGKVYKDFIAAFFFCNVKICPAIGELSKF